MRTVAFLLAAAAAVSAATIPLGPLEAVEVRAGRVDAPTVVLVSDAFARREAARYARIPKARRAVRLMAIAVADPEILQFPAQGRAYRDNAEAHAIERFVAWTAPEVVAVAGEGFEGLQARRVKKRAGVVARLGTIARVERRARTPMEVAQRLASIYGQEFPEAVYIPAMALIARIRLGQTAEVEKLTADFVYGGKDSLGKVTSSHFAGHLVFAELAERTGKREYSELVRKAADAAIASGGLNNEMSDSVFMVCPLLVKARRFDEAERHFLRMRELCRRPDGLWRHSPLSETAWGRGNAFVALGLALSLQEMQSAVMLAEYRELMAKLAEFQDPFSGMFRQVIDDPKAWGELSATAMIGRAMRIGIRRGWLDSARFGPVVERAWKGVEAHVFEDGKLLDVCEGTGKQKSLQDYSDREAIWGRNARGGGMVMLFALEMTQ